MSPAAMCSLMVRTPASNTSRVTFVRISGAFRPAGARLREPALELALEELDLRARELVERRQILVGRHARVGDDQDAVLDVIEREHRVEQHEPGFVFVSPPSSRFPSSPFAGAVFVHAAFFHASSSAGSKPTDAS